MISFGRCAALVALVLSSLGFLAAQDPGAGVSTSDPTTQFMLAQKNTSGYRAKIQAAVAAFEKGLESHCKNVSLDFDSGGVTDKILAPIYRNDNGVAVAGSWRETVPGTACGQELKFNVRVDATLSGLQFTGTFPGQAAGDPDLQRDTFKSIQSAFDERGIETKKGCHLEVIDTHLVGPSPILQADGNLSPWQETWNVKSCETVYLVPISYVFDGSGTSIKISSSEIKAE